MGVEEIRPSALGLGSRCSGVGVGAVFVFFTAVGVGVGANRKLLVVSGGVFITVFFFFYVDRVGWWVGLDVTKRRERSVEWGWRWYG